MQKLNVKSATSVTADKPTTPLSAENEDVLLRMLSDKDIPPRFGDEQTTTIATVLGDESDYL